MSYYSISRINTYNSCPQKYKFHYIDRIKPPSGEVSLNSLVGSCVHKTLETMYRKYMSTKIWPTLEEIKEEYLEIWDQEYSQNIIVIHLADNPEKFKKDGLEILNTYFLQQKEKEFIDQTIAVERSFFVTIDGYKIKAIVDRIDYKENDTFLIHDYKTTSRFPEIKNLENDRQLPLYQMAVKETYPDAKNISLTWHFLRFSKSVTITKNDSELNEIKSEIVENIKTIELDRNFQPNKTPLCGWCSYKDICPAFKHSFTLKSLENNTLDEGYQAVNELAAIQLTMKEHKFALKKLEEEKKQWEQRATDYAVLKNLASLEGKDHELTVDVKREIAFPDSKDPARVYLENFLKEHGLWEKASILYSSKVKKVLVDPMVSKEIQKELMSFSYIKDSTSCRLKRKKE
jgi:putative RecB family exonuclease